MAPGEGEEVSVPVPAELKNIMQDMNVWEEDAYIKQKRNRNFGAGFPTRCVTIMYNAKISFGGWMVISTILYDLCDL